VKTCSLHGVKNLSRSVGVMFLRSTIRWKDGKQLKFFAAERRLLAAAADRAEVRLKDLSYIGLRSGATAGFSASCGNNCNSMSFGEFDWVSVVKAPIGSTCSRHWFATGYWIRDPGSEWHLHRVWFEQSAMGDLLGEDFSIAAKDSNP